MNRRDLLRAGTASFLGALLARYAGPLPAFADGVGVAAGRSAVVLALRPRAGAFGVVVFAAALPFSVRGALEGLLVLAGVGAAGSFVGFAFFFVGVGFFDGAGGFALRPPRLLAGFVLALAVVFAGVVADRRAV